MLIRPHIEKVRVVFAPQGSNMDATILVRAISFYHLRRISLCPIAFQNSCYLCDRVAIDLARTVGHEALISQSTVSTNLVTRVIS